MLFNSFWYILLFLPSVLITYFFISEKISFKFAKGFLAIASFLFYAWWNSIYLILILFSIITNYSCAYWIDKYRQQSKIFLMLGIVFNLSLLAYFKYANFFIDNLNYAVGSHLFITKIILPLGISFFTFTQIAYLIDIHQSTAKQSGLLNYCLFVSYFPHLLAGPIIHHAQVMPQFNDLKNAALNYKNIYLGIVLFSIGLFKKVIIADTFALFANNGYTHIGNLTTTTAWVTALAYTFQIYFDFSGYTDMALGASKLFNIELPINFNSPYQALNIQEFWRRWHITLSNFLRDYLYIPLGGSRVSELKIHRNLVLTFILGGLWHGAGWNYIFWGFLHGSALSIQRIFNKTSVKLPKLVSWFITFNFVNLTWVFFRANSFHDAAFLITKMFSVIDLNAFNPILSLLFFITASIVFKAPNSLQITNMQSTQRLAFIPVISVVILISIFSMQISDSHAFIYFQF
jgi:alginate O-acetyltransferase complex protein AlgI